MNNEKNIGIIEAVEALSSIADLDLDRELGIMQKKELRFQEHHITFKTVHWMNQEERELGISQIKNVFSVVLKYINEFYQKDFDPVEDPQTIEGIKTLMVLVGEAAKKIDKYQALFESESFKSVTDSSDYKSLQDFYRKKISHVIDEGVLGKWILGVTRQVWAQKPSIRFEGKKSGLTKHLFIDLDSVKKDTDYELFYIRKEDGSRFFSPRLIRNIKLVSDFGNYFNNDEKADLLLEVPLWMDRHLQSISGSMYRQVKSQLDLFYREAIRFKDHELVGDLSKATMALMLASHPNSLKNHPENKKTRGYFADFLMFFRAALKTKEYEKLMTYPPKSGHAISHVLINTCNSLARALYTHEDVLATSYPLVLHLNNEGKKQASNPKEKDSTQMWSHLADSWQTLSKIIKEHTNGPLSKVLDSIEEGDYNRFEPLNVDNIPNPIFNLFVEGERVGFYRIPAPIIQETTDRAYITPEWKAFVNSKKAREENHLLINMQDRTSWKESGRAFCVEKHAQDNATVTLAVDTDFYHQTGPYHEPENWDKFTDIIMDQVLDPQAGFYFSDDLSRGIAAFVPLAIESIHLRFFKERKQLTRDERQIFINLLYLMISLKALEITSAKTVSFSCKDGIDTGNLYSCLLWGFFRIVNEEFFTTDSLENFEGQLFGPALLTRERMPIHDRFQRILKTLHYLEDLKGELGYTGYQKQVKGCLHELFGKSFTSTL